MRILIVGLGSMGKRRVRNLQALGIAEIHGFEVRADRREEVARQYGIAVSDNLEQSLALRPDAIVISLPPDIHVPYALHAIDAGIPFFTEASVVSDGMPEMIARLRRAGVLGVPSRTMRYYPGPTRLRELVQRGEIGRPLAWVYHSGQYLPDWHPWEPIENFYVSKRATGGCREIVPFELVWLTELFGPVTSVSGQKDKLSDLPADIDDIYQLQVRHAFGVLGQLTVDVLARPAVRYVRILGTEGTAEWDASRKVIRCFTASAGTWREEDLGSGTIQKGYLNPEEPYIQEMADFLACVREKREPAYTFENDLAILRVLEASEESSGTGRRVEAQVQQEEVPS